MASKWNLLQEALDDEGLSARGLARLWAGAGATPSQIESARSQINRWLNNGKRPDRKNALKLARLLHKPKEHFVTTNHEPKPTVASLTRRVEDLAADLEKVRAELARSRKQGRG